MSNAPTHFGAMAYEIVSDVDHGKINATVESPSRKTPTNILLLCATRPARTDQERQGQRSGINRFRRRARVGAVESRQRPHSRVGELLTHSELHRLDVAYFQDQ